jgi:hypothetical protein
LTDIPTICSAGAQAQIPLRLTIVIAIAATPALLLSGYLPEDDSRKPLAAHDQKREQLGFTQGTPEGANCRLERAREATHEGHHQLRQTEHLHILARVRRRAIARLRPRGRVWIRDPHEWPDKPDPDVVAVTAWLERSATNSSSA